MKEGDLVVLMGAFSVEPVLVSWQPTDVKESLPSGTPAVLVCRQRASAGRRGAWILVGGRVGWVPIEDLVPVS